VKNRLLKTHVWKCSYARKEKKEGKEGGFIVVKRKGWGNKEDRLISKEWEGVIISELMMGREKINIISTKNKEEKIWI